MNITGSGYSERGGRDYNEDCGTMRYCERSYCVAIADGLGGHGGGNLASEHAVKMIESCFADERDEEITEEKLQKWFEAANAEVMRLQSQECQMKTTLAVLCVDKYACKAAWAHMGDSRIYHFIDGRLDSCTFDHSVSRMAVLAGEISMEDIRFHADRNKLLKALGKSDEVKAETHSEELDMSQRHAFLLCTDGFWEYVTEQEMESMYANADDVKQWLSQMRAKVKKTAKEGNDNNSAIALWVE